MKFKQLSPTQIITTQDFPVYNTNILEQYFNIYKKNKGDDLPPVPLIHVNLAFPYFTQPVISLLQEFLEKNPQVEFFLLNGSHRTTAANLTRHQIKGVVLEQEGDIKPAQQIKFKGKKYQHLLEDTIIENIEGLVKHFHDAKKFETVQEKTDRMIKERTIPQYIIDYYGIHK